jgi:tetratricopeptide (TPR) repeat protein
MTTSSAAPAAPRPARTVELVLAHTHLRLGSLALARVELETMAGMGLLDTGGIIDLAEVRWRTGDLLGAGEAASAALRDDPEHPIALVIAAEAASALGRPTEARRLADQAVRASRGALDAIFAGMPRSGVWPADAAEPPPTAPTLFDREPEAALAAASTVAPGHHPPVTERRPSTTPTPLTLGLWEAEDGSETVATPPPDPAAELEAGRDALVAGTIDDAVLHFSLALRLAPALAPAVLEATDGARGPGLMMVRGDAYRLAGHEAEAQQAYVIAAHGGLPDRRREPRGDAPPVAPGGVPTAGTGTAAADAAVVETETPPAADAEPVDASPRDHGSDAEPEAADASAVPAGEVEPTPAASDASDGTVAGAEGDGAGTDGGADRPPAANEVDVTATRVVASSSRSGAKSSGKSGTGAAKPVEGQPSGEPAAVAARSETPSAKPAAESPTKDGSPG